MSRYECFGMGCVSEEKCGDCEQREDCQFQHDTDMEEWALLSEHEKLYGSDEEDD